VKVFNLVTPAASDSWNCLSEIEGQELMARLFCDVIIKNTGSERGDHFWDNAELNLLKALVLYVERGYPPEKRNIGEVCQLLAMSSEKELNAIFDVLDMSHPAKAPYSIFKQSSESVRGGVIIGLGSRLQVFQNKDIRNITGYDEIDLELPGKQPCAYYCITSDQDSTFDFLSSLFLPFIFIKLVRYAGQNCPGGALPVPVHVLGEELCACGVIPDLSRKISVIRSRNISMSCVFQNLAGLQNRYPQNQWQEILGNCDITLFLGCTDALTAQFISDRTGEASIAVTSKAKQLGAWRISNYTPEYRETSGVGKRKLMTMDEVLRMDVDRALVILRGRNVLEVDKYDYSKHPEAKKLHPSKAASHIPAWQTTPKAERKEVKPAPPKARPTRSKPKKSAPPKTAAPAEGVQEDAPGGEIPAADPQYEDLLHEMESTTPFSPAEDGDAAPQDDPPPLMEPSADDALLEELPSSEAQPVEAGNAGEAPAERTARPRARRAPPTQRSDYVLTIDARDRVQTEEEREEIIWHEIRNAYRTRRILTGILGGVEQTKSGRTLAIVDYKGFRVAIPILEMLLYTGEMPSNREYLELMGRLNRMLSTMLGAEIDFMVKGIDSNTRSIVASRKDAMLRKRQSFYMDTDALGEHLIYEGRVVQARVIAVAEKIIRVEAFGVECAIVARDLSWEWLGDARDHFSVGSRILIRIQSIDRSSLEGMTITADVRSVSSTTNLDNVKKCQPQCRYAGRVTDVRGGVVYIRLNNGVNAIAHACYDLRTPGKKDDVSFAVTRLDEEKGIAIGIITRIIKQNL